MRDISKIADKLSFFWTFCVMASGLLAGLLPLHVGDRHVTPIPGWFPYDVTKTPLYQISYIWQVFCQLNLGLIYGATDTLYTSIMILVSRQFKILASNIQNNCYSTILRLGAERKAVLDFMKRIPTDEYGLNRHRMVQNSEGLKLFYYIF